jgi:tetratricopeptide (TPR) repeat protein
MQLQHLLDSGDLHRAERLLRNACTAHPQVSEAWAQLATVQTSLGMQGVPLQNMLRAIALHPSDLQLRNQLGLILIDHGELDIAARSFQAILRHEPDNRDAIAGMATVLERRGDLIGAARLLGPHTTDPHVRIATVWATICRRLSRPHHGVPALEAALQMDLIGPARSMVLRELGWTLDALGNTSGAWAAMAGANAEQRGRYDPADHEARTTAIIETFDAALLDAAPRSDNRSDLPVFIVGMPRSGTSLVERILAAHPAVTPGGELNDLRTLTRYAAQHLDGGYPGCIRDMDATIATQLGTAYLDRRHATAPDALRVTDKMPQNFRHLGLAALILPGARVIHCVRDLEDTALSCFFQGFKSKLAWSERMDWLGHYAAQYQRMMRHWAQVLPMAVHTVRYESLVADPKTESRRLVEFCGLRWDERLLQTGGSGAITNTASYAQVQRPIYTTSVGRSGPYRDHLAPFRAALCQPFSHGETHVEDTGSAALNPTHTPTEET